MIKTKYEEKGYEYTVNLYRLEHVIRSLQFKLGSIHWEFKMNKQGFKAR